MTPTPAVSPSPVYIDYTGLEKQITVAEGLKSGEYTTESWDAMQNALAAASDALESKDQNTVNAAADELKSCIASLTRVDYSKLQQALNDAQVFMESEERVTLWQQQMDAIDRGKALLTSGDQRAIDEAAAALQTILAQNQAAAESNQNPSIVEVEVPVEVLPEDDYCNIPVHGIWPVLFFVSAALNLALIALIVVYMVKKKKYNNDDTPLVDYDIGDDF